MTQINLPAVSGQTALVVDQLMAALNLPRNLVAGADEIERVWIQLPRFIQQIPVAERNELHVRMCIAVSSGLFDAAINYAWNAAMLKLRQRIRDFGFPFVGQVLAKPFAEQDLLKLQDSELLDLCLRVNLISREAFKFLDQNRDVRNHFSAAHPPLGSLDDTEFLNFLNRCTKYALSATSNLKGVDLGAFINALKGTPFSTEQVLEWTRRVSATHDEQRRAIISTLHGLYCDPNSTGDTRGNSLTVAESIKDSLDDDGWSAIICRHSDYMAAGDNAKQAASRTFFEKLNSLSRLGAAELHSIVVNACHQMMAVHLASNNFYNEPPFAQRLAEVSKTVAIPETAQKEFVETVCACAVGNSYGVCWSAQPYYLEMVRNFSPREIEIMFDLSRGSSRFGDRIRLDSSARQRFSVMARQLNPQTVPLRYQQDHQHWISQP